MHDLVQLCETNEQGRPTNYNVGTRQWTLPKIEKTVEEYPSFRSKKI